MSGPPSPLIENYLREARFWHVATIGRGCKLDPKLISALIEKWRPKTRRIELGVCRVGNVVQGNVQGDVTEQSQNRRLSITTAIISTISLSIFTSSSGPFIYISTHNEVEPFSELYRNTYLSRRYTASTRPTIGSIISMDTIRGSGNLGNNCG
ncbi:hypothetical protein J1N35_005175 [Gossypium stocksii]|uniref:Aminotransferase-like plant mobile domain-containing protein n=1 Tax=Gossypium stocksii TaxID=47602 RepID=A0A9D4AJ10_9ROSI|nr:hypothetical protein J1N35_005175 [Gossypium stocksii]